MASCQNNPDPCCQASTIIQNCSGFNGYSGDQLFTYWQQNNCTNAYEQLINTSGNTLAYNPDNNINIMQYCVLNLFESYTGTDTITDNTADPNYNTFQNTLLDLCINPALPGVCTAALEQVVCSGVTRSQALASPILTDFCGCYVPADSLYTNPNGPIGNSPQCDPLCHRVLTSQQADLTTGELITCDMNICAINETTINATSSNSVNGVNFINICGGCGTPGSDGCLCIVTGTNISNTLGSIGIGDNIEQFCGSNSLCFVQAADGSLKQTKCESGNITLPEEQPSPFWPWIIIFGVLLLVVILIIFAAR